MENFQQNINDLSYYRSNTTFSMVRPHLGGVEIGSETAAILVNPFRILRAMESCLMEELRASEGVDWMDERYKVAPVKDTRPASLPEYYGRGSGTYTGD